MINVKQIRILMVMLALVFATKASAQNIVINPGFETFGTVTCGWTGTPTDFANAVPGITSPTGATPDVFSTLISNTCSNNQPHTTYTSPNGWQAPHTGNMFGGFYTYVASSTWREYIQVHFSQPMILGTPYRISFYISLGDNSQYATNNIGAEFYTTQQNLGITNEIGGTPSVNFTQVMNDSTNWVLFSDTVVASAANQYMIIGNFKNDAGTIISPFWSGATWDRTYYYIDDISVEPIAVTANNFCFGDSTAFVNAQLTGWVASAWNFGDSTSGLNNIAYTLNASHVFSAPGNYSITTINYYLNGTSDTILTDITISPSPVVNLGNDTTLCNGQMLVLQASGGNLYAWSTGDTTASITVTSAGIYSVFVDNNGCTAIDTINISNTNCSPMIALAASDSSFCEKQCIDFYDLSNNSPTSWQWLFSGASPDTSSLQNPTNICYNNYGSFDVQLIACNAFGCDTLLLTQFITELQNPADSIWISNDTLYSLPFPSYQWYEISSGLIAGATNPYFVVSAPGSYYCVVNDTIGCVATSNTLTITGITGPLTPKGEIKIFPNPNSGTFEIAFNSSIGNKKVDLKIYDAIGKVVFQSSLVYCQLSIAAPGIYFVEIKSNGTFYRQKMIVE